MVRKRGKFRRRSAPAFIVAVVGALVTAWWQAGERSHTPVELVRVPHSAMAEREVSSEVSGKKDTVLSGKVIRVADGDTITVMNGDDHTSTKVRLVGIDAPEKKQPFGEVCRKKLADEVAGQMVRVVSFGKDRYGRLLGQIWYNNLDINLLQIEKGCAWHYRQYAKNLTDEMRVSYSKQEALSQRERRGLWRDPAPEAPWDFRQSGRKRKVATDSAE